MQPGTPNVVDGLQIFRCSHLPIQPFHPLQKRNMRPHIRDNLVLGKQLVSNATPALLHGVLHTKAARLKGRWGATDNCSFRQIGVIPPRDTADSCAAKLRRFPPIRHLELLPQNFIGAISRRAQTGQGRNALRRLVSALAFSIRITPSFGGLPDPKHARYA